MHNALDVFGLSQVPHVLKLALDPLPVVQVGLLGVLPLFFALDYIQYLAVHLVLLIASDLIYLFSELDLLVG